MAGSELWPASGEVQSQMTAVTYSRSKEGGGGGMGGKGTPSSAFLEHPQTGQR